MLSCPLYCVYVGVLLFSYRLGRAPTPAIDQSDTEEESDGQKAVEERDKKPKQSDADKADDKKTEAGSKGTSSAACEPPESKPSTSRAKQSDEGLESFP
jgi:hypothetical protein